MKMKLFVVSVLGLFLMVKEVSADVISPGIVGSIAEELGIWKEYRIFIQFLPLIIFVLVIILIVIYIIKRNERKNKEKEINKDMNLR